MRSFLFNLFKPMAVFIFASVAAWGQATEPATHYVLALGDSLTAGYRLDPDASFPAQLQTTLRNEGLSARVINAGVSGDTTSGGLARLDWSLADIPDGKPDLAILALGANDALRGIDPDTTRANLDAILTWFHDREITVLLMGMKAPLNMGPAFGADFDRIYPELAAQHKVTLYPFFLEGVATIPELNLADGMHPTREGVQVIVTRVAPVVTRLLTQ